MNVQANIGFKYKEHLGLMQLSELLTAVGELIPYEYAAIRKPEYDRLIANILSSATPQRTPRFVQIGGIPGAGKTTFCKNARWDEQLFISFDKIMEALPGYQVDIYRLGTVEAFNRWEMPARIIGYEVLRRAVEKKANIYLEHSGVNMPHTILMQNLKKKGYATEMYFILCNLDIACHRAELREKITNRHTSKEMIVKRNELVKTYLNQYKTLVDNLYIYDTSNNKFTLQSNYRRGIQVVL